MDPVTQAALGAACSQAVLHQYDKKNAWLIGALGGAAADLDLLIRSSTDPMLTLIYHRQFTHSFIFIPIGAMIVTLAFLPFQRFRNKLQFTFLAALIGYATHAVLDACTSYGTVLLWPFTDTRYALDWISVINPLFTLPLIVGLIATIIYDHRLPVFVGIICAGLFLGLNIMQHQRAIAAVESFSQRQNLHIKRLRVFPELARSTKWRGVAQINKQLLLTRVETPWFSASKVQSIARFPLFQGDELPDYVYHSDLLRRDLNIFIWFTDGYLLKVKQNPLILADARYITGEDELVALWGISLKPNNQHANELRSIPLEKKDIK